MPLKNLFQKPKKKSSLLDLCETRFIEAANVFVEFFVSILASLQNIQETDCAISACTWCKACSFLKAVKKLLFHYFSLKIFIIICKALSVKDQFSVCYAKNIIKRLKHMRQNSNESLTLIFKCILILKLKFFVLQINISIGIIILIIHQNSVIKYLYFNLV